MKQLKDIPSEEAAILANLRECVARIQQLITPAITNVSSGVALLRSLRNESAEDINQLQHAALALDAARHIQTQRPETASLDWYWHPFQTGGIDEPDLQARSGSEIVISAEATDSERPGGGIDKRMADTLKKLQAMPGERFYFVRTESMQQRAQTKVHKAGYAISIATILNA
jgi:hypothetical protein